MQRRQIIGRIAAAGFALCAALPAIAQDTLKVGLILPLSGAQMIVPVDRMADGSARGDEQPRRRMEIRLRKSSSRSSPTPSPYPARGR